MLCVNRISHNYTFIFFVPHAINGAAFQSLTWFLVLTFASPRQRLFRQYLQETNYVGPIDFKLYPG